MLGKQLTGSEQQELSERLAELAQSGMPLGAGLEAAARETRSRRVRRRLIGLADQINAGVPWEDIFVQNKTGLPPHTLGLLQAGIRSGTLGEALDDLIDHQQMLRDMWRRVGWALAYPLTLMVLLMLLIVFVMIMVVRPMKHIYQDFGTTLPTLTLGWIWLAETGIRVMGCLVLFGAVVCLGIRLFGGRVLWTRFVSGLPVFGALWHWSGVAEFARLLKTLLARQVPLPEALQLVSTALSNANLADVSRWFSEGTAAGIPLSELIAATTRMPACVVPIVRWGEQTGALDEAMASISEMYEGRIDLRASVLTTLLPPLCFIAIAAGAVSLVIGLFMPLVSLIQNLS